VCHQINDSAPSKLVRVASEGELLCNATLLSPKLTRCLKEAKSKAHVLPTWTRHSLLVCVGRVIYKFFLLTGGISATESVRVILVQE
jgi:hypothetical protein